jgi:hypothetical protein
MHFTTNKRKKEKYLFARARNKCPHPYPLCMNSHIRRDTINNNNKKATSKEEGINANAPLHCRPAGLWLWGEGEEEEEIGDTGTFPHY